MGTLEQWAVGSGDPTADTRSGQWAVGVDLYTTLLRWAVGSGDRSVHCHTVAWGQWAVDLPLNTPHYLGAVVHGTPAVHCCIAAGQQAMERVREWAVELLLLPRCLGAVGSVVWWVWCGVVWCGVVWCGVVWCGVVWCGVVWCGVPKGLLPNGNGCAKGPVTKWQW